jgi:hypothetical protein
MMSGAPANARATPPAVGGVGFHIAVVYASISDVMRDVGAVYARGSYALINAPAHSSEHMQLFVRSVTSTGDAPTWVYVADLDAAVFAHVGVDRTRVDDVLVCRQCLASFDATTLVNGVDVGELCRAVFRTALRDVLVAPRRRGGGGGGGQRVPVPLYEWVCRYAGVA